MTPDNFSQELNIEYNNITSNLAAPLNEYEKSVFLTKALEQIVFELIPSYETNERARKLLVPLLEVATLKPTVHNLDEIRIADNSVFFLLPNDLIAIVYEDVKIKSTVNDKCLAGKHVEVFPTSHDTYYRIKDNPFRGNSSRRCMRFDVSIGDYNIKEYIDAEDSQFPIDIVATSEEVDIHTETSAFGKFSEIVYNKSKEIEYYKIRYLRMPHPIITVNLLTEYPQKNVSINGYTDVSGCELDASIHRSIVETAAAMAASAYKRVERVSN
mgnify:CR=1 FL=1